MFTQIKKFDLYRYIDPFDLYQYGRDIKLNRKYIMLI